MFRSNASTADEGTYTIVPSFARDPDYEASPPATPLAVVVTAPVPANHAPPRTSVQLACAAGTNRLSPLFIDKGDSTACALIVTDNNGLDANGDPTYVTPSGTASWAAPSHNGSAGGFSSNSCALTRLSDQTAQCSTVYIPSVLATPDGPDFANTHPIQAVYTGDAIHPPLAGAADVFVRDVHQVQVIFICSPATTPAAPLVISSGQSTQCTVTVTDTASFPQTPTGNVDWTAVNPGGAPNPGTWSPASCALLAVSTSAAQCQTTYTPTSVFPPNTTSAHQLSATYTGDWLHQPPLNPAGPVDVYVKN